MPKIGTCYEEPKWWECKPLIVSVDLEKLVRVEPPPSHSHGPICETAGKPLEMTFTYTGGGPRTASNQQGSKFSVTGQADDDSSAFIVVTDRKFDPKKGFDELLEKGDVYFQGTVTQGEAFTATSGGEKFSSNTYFYVFDEEGGALLQTSQYHTSCSAPINLGDNLGGMILTEYVGQDGRGTLGGGSGGAPGPNDLDADDPTGPEAHVGSDVVFTYKVTNDGDVALKNVWVWDDNGTPDDPRDDFTLTGQDLLGGDTNGNNLLDPGETWLFTSTTEALLGQQKNVAYAGGTSVKDGTTNAQDTDVAHYLGVEKAMPMGDLCEVFGKPEALMFRYDRELRDASESAQGKKLKITGSAEDDDDGSYIIVSDKKFDAKKGVDYLLDKGKVYFDGFVFEGDTFTASSSDAGKDKFGGNLYIHVFDDEDGGLLHSMNYHTSCSAPIELNDTIGSMTLVGYDGQNGDMFSLI